MYPLAFGVNTDGSPSAEFLDVHPSAESPADDDLDDLGGGGGGGGGRSGGDGSGGSGGVGDGASSPKSSPVGKPPHTTLKPSGVVPSGMVPSSVPSSGAPPPAVTSVAPPSALPLPVLGVPTPQRPATPRLTTSATTTTTTRTTTTTTFAPFTELICTVSGFAVFSTMYPPDGLCHFLFYWNVVVSGGTMRGVEVSTSWDVFKKEMIKRKNTSGGISFDSRYVTAGSIRSVEKELNDLTTRNIMHYGVLNMLATAAKAHVLWQRTKVLLKELKTIQGNDSNKRIILAMGLYDYGSQGEYYGDFTILFREAIEQSSADTVIAISSVGWLYDRSRCECTPPSVWDTEALPGLPSTLARKYPDLRRHAVLMSKRHRYSLKIKTGLSFELATLVYNRTQSYQHQGALDVAFLYSECNLFFTTNYDVVPCKNVSRLTRSLVHPDVGIASAELQPSLIFIFEDEDTLEKKCNDLARLSTYLRPNMAILLLNVHLGDYSVNSCGNDDPLRADPFWRIRVVKRTLAIT
ncbi:uncharacterized protein [Dermacentor albipictus]|uniref:uncharacterized protein isoform X2 n=1 Tax=Dermacentor albipictus TaxID=60249 RepID=UPI0031FD8E81